MIQLKVGFHVWHLALVIFLFFFWIVHIDNGGVEMFQLLFTRWIKNLDIHDWNTFDKHLKKFNLQQLVHIQTKHINSPDIFDYEQNICRRSIEWFESVIHMIDTRQDFNEFLRFFNILNENAFRTQITNKEIVSNEKGQDKIMTNEIIGKWMLKDVIGKGGFGFVYKAINIQDEDEIAAIKFIQIKKSSYIQLVFREINALSKVNDVNIVEMFDYKLNINDKTMIMIVMEHCENGDLYQYLKFKTKFDLRMTFQFFKQIVNGLTYCHNVVNIAHRDLKPQNLLLNDEFQIKIADFGLCKLTSQEELSLNANPNNDDGKDNNNYNNIGNCEDATGTKTHFAATNCGTLGFMAPEMFFTNKSRIYLRNESDYFKCDIFSLGIILWQMLNGIDSKPFEIFDNPQDTLDHWYKYRLISQKKYNLWWNHFQNDIDYHYDHHLKNLFVRMFDHNPQTRVSINGIKAHKWYQKYNEMTNIVSYYDYHIHSMSLMRQQMLIAKEKDMYTAVNQSVTTNNTQSVSILILFFFLSSLNDCQQCCLLLRLCVKINSQCRR